MTAPLTPPDLPEPPYPADTLARGWRFEVDMEKVKRSDTWKKAKTGAMRGALLLLWAEAWQEEPCGTLPDDPELIALMIDMPLTAFEKNMSVLLRGWSKATDGRLYHETITARVLAMLDKRANDAERAANRRARKAESAAHRDGVTDASRVTNTGVGPEFDTKHQAPSTNTSEPTVLRGARKRAAGPACPDDVDPQVWSDWLALRKAKRAPVTETTVGSARAEAEKAGLSFEAFLRVWCARGSQGLQADWLKPHERGGTPVIPVNRQEAIEQRNRAVGDRWLAEQEDVHATQ